MVLPSPIVPADSRGNRLLDYRFTQDRVGPNHYVNVRCTESVAAHVEDLLSTKNPRRYLLPSGSDWTHCFRFDGPYRDDLRDTLELLKDVLHVPVCENLDGMFALDFYKEPPPEDDPSWGWTEVGDLIYRAKYWRSDPNEQRRSEAKLADLLADAVQRHKLMRGVDYIVAVPGSSTPSFGESLAGAVASRCTVPIVGARLCPGSNPGPAKEGHIAGTRREYQLGQSVEGCDILVVDDVYRSGTTMRSVALAARAAGAQRVFGFVGARTHRK